MRNSCRRRELWSVLLQIQKPYGWDSRRLSAMPRVSVFALFAAQILPRATCPGAEKNLRASAVVHKWFLSIHRSGFAF
jgi:hypothetical protein